jgi:hypothetical protein
MKKAGLVVILIVSFMALFPISWRLADPFFTHPFRKGLHNDPVLLVCPDHVEIHWLHELPDGSPVSMGARCTFNVEPGRQKWVEQTVRVLPSPNPGKSAWRIRVKQVGEAQQQIDLELLGDGIFGMIYETNPGGIVPLQSRLAGPSGAAFPLVINVILWATGWCLVRLGRKAWERV